MCCATPRPTSSTVLRTADLSSTKFLFSSHWRTFSSGHWMLDAGLTWQFLNNSGLCLSSTALECAVRSPLGLDNCHSETWWLSTFPNGKKRSSVSQSCVQVASKLSPKCPEVVSKSLHSLSISSFSPHVLFIFSFSLVQPCPTPHGKALFGFFSCSVAIFGPICMKFWL